MKTIINDLENEIIIKKSKFIGIIKKTTDISDIPIILDNIKLKYKDASHICYAYIVDNNKKYSDDKEPKGTAGLPILNVLEKNNLNYCIAIVIRYFGGIKLGSSNLLRAYQNTILSLLDNNIKDCSLATKIQIIANYQNINNIKYLLGNAIITKEDYHENILIEAIVDNNDLHKLDNYQYKIINSNIIIWYYCVFIHEKPFSANKSISSDGVLAYVISDSGRLVKLEKEIENFVISLILL